MVRDARSANSAVRCWQVLYDLSEEYGSPSCDEDLRAAALTLVTILSEPNNPAHRKRNPEYDESSDRSLAGRLD